MAIRETVAPSTWVSGGATDLPFRPPGFGKVDADDPFRQASVPLKRPIGLAIPGETMKA